MNITRAPGQALIPDSLLIHILANSMGELWTGAGQARRGNDIQQISFIPESQRTEIVHCGE